MYSLALAAGLLLAVASCNGPIHTGEPQAPLPDPGQDPAHGVQLTDGVGAFTDFGLRLFHQVRSADGDRNVFLAPASVAFALAMTHQGAQGETRQGIAEALGVETARVDAAASALRGVLASEREGVRLHVANSLWARQGVPFLPGFLQHTRDRFGAEVATLDFTDPAAPARINEWVSRQTEGRIPTLIERIDPLEVLFLVNAVYFEGRWTHRFDPRATRPADFTLGSGQRISHPMMSQTGEFRSLRGEGWQAVSLPYGADESLAMYVFLPDEGRGLADFYRQLTPGNWERWMQEFRPGRMMVSIPRFRMEYSVGLASALQRMGMSIAFDPGRADFGGMLPREYLDRNNAYITRVEHRTFVEVNEQGTEAAGATAVGIGIVSMPPQFTADRPFFFAIRDGRSGEVLFAGQVVDPR